MKVKYQTVDVRRSELSVIRLTVPVWETPLLNAVHPLGADVVQDVTVDVDDVPEAATEFRRLTERYGVEIRADGSRGAPIAEAVYGQFATGTMNLQRAIDTAVAA